MLANNSLPSKVSYYILNIYFILKKATSVSTSDLATNTQQLNVDKFKQELIEVLTNFPDYSMELQRIPEEFSRHFHRPFLLSEYGAKKTSQLLQELTDIVQVLVLKLSNPSREPRWWCNGQHCCLPSSRSGFDSRPTHTFTFFTVIFF